MSVTIENLGNLDRKITLSFPKADTEKARAARLQKLSKTVKMAGFRPGKVPMKMVEAQYGMQVDFETQFDHASNLFYELSQKEGLKIAGQPRLEPKSEIAADPVVYDATFEVFPEVKVGDLTKAEITRYTTDVNDVEIDKTLEILRKQRVHFHVRGDAGAHGNGGDNTAAQTGDQVTVDFVGKIDGIEFAGGKAENFAFILGEGRMLPEFEAAATGLKAGESKTFPLAFPADYHGKDVAGKTADFTITMKKVEWPHLPTVDDDFAKSLGVAEGVAKMREEIRTNLTREVKRRTQALLKSQVMEALTKVCELDVPKGLAAQEQERLIANARQDLAARGIPNAKDAPIPAELFTAQAEQRVKLGLILNELVKQQSLEAKPEQIKAEIEEQSSSYEDPKEVMRWYYSDPKRLADVEALVLENNVVAYVNGLAKVADKAVTFEELSQLN
ncbi:trigger factor [Polynucleobacter sp. MWH-Spelu-300-X4]|jgi:trigger factor|uniref:trigger factor n=1 Tax=Polynucleobacter sp. MWH-Spelu-300-X4 TaxID=2689109 RepID=UPI001BFD1DE7|nr:trigger factor [Polynucleobacter sp. MWH-Spelu-300-X4]QWD78984.1 trigger factor [Polynucleobacter sp. MWH-Spelu-300-X4]